MRILIVPLLFGLATAAVAAPSPTPQPIPPSSVIFSNLYSFTTGVESYTAPVIVPSDGAWLYGIASYGSGSYMDCDHRYEVRLSPSGTSPDYDPLLTLGYVPGIDTPCVFSSACFSCSINFGGFKPQTYYTTARTPGWLPGGASTARLSTLTGGSSEPLKFYLAQVNASALQSMYVYEALSDTMPAPAAADDINSRAYIAGSDDHVPLVPQFTYGVDTYPAPLTATFNATWDTGEAATVANTNPYGHPGNQILLISVPRMKTGKHKVTVTASLPSGTTWVAPAYEVYVYNGALEAVVDGGPPASSPASFIRGQNVLVRLKQQDTGGKQISVALADWSFRNPADQRQIKASDEPAFPPASREWSGVMHQSGLVIATFTFKTGKYKRVSHASLTMLLSATARTDSVWTTARTLCEDCWTDLGVADGGYVSHGLFFPSWRNLLASANFQTNGTNGGLTLAMTGDRKLYEQGLKDANSTYLVEPRRITKSFPLYRPVDAVNDPEDWGDRYAVAQIASGPNRGYWFVTWQTFRTDWAYGVNAYLVPGSPEGADTNNYKSFALIPGCLNAADRACYQAATIPCWAQTHGTTSYLQEALNSSWDLGGTLAATRTHEKTRHWEQWLVNYVTQKKATYDIGPIMEAIAVYAQTAVGARNVIDQFVADLNLAYAQDTSGGANETSDPTPRPPVVDDANYTQGPPCSFIGGAP